MTNGAVYLRSVSVCIQSQVHLADILVTPPAVICYVGNRHATGSFEKEKTGISKTDYFWKHDSNQK